MDPKGPIQISYDAGPDNHTEHFDHGLQSFEFALHHLVEELGRFYRDGSIRVEKIEDGRLMLSYEEDPGHRVWIIYSGGPIRHLNMVARWFVAETGAGSDEVKLLVWRMRRQSKHPSVA